MYHFKPNEEMPLKLQGFQVNMFAEITYIVWDPESREAAIVDAGMSEDDEVRAIDNYLSDNNLTLKYLINTHLHIDHCFGVEHIKSKYGLGLMASKADEILSSRLKEQAQMFRLPIDVENISIEHDLKDGDVLHLGKEELKVISVPGHSPGGIALYAPDSKFVITGDSLFHRSIGRTDLPGGDHATLIRAVTDKLLSLPGDTKVFPGHGPSTTIAEEHRFNPYL
ncbi:MAG: MBL fold metallo-hydrolase [Muribaculaceae bacterium]|nr:MBL fold metallo-hydrolase [Muribaculaceae bacterium]